MNLTKINGWFEKNRVAQQNFWLETLVQEEIRKRFQQIPEFNQLLDDAENKIENGDANAFVMAQQIVNQIFEKYVKKS